MIPSLEPRLSSSYSSLAFRTVSGEKLDESLGSRLHDSSTTAAADVGGEYTSVRLAGQWGVASFSFALVSRLRSYTPSQWGRDGALLRDLAAKGCPYVWA